MYIYIYISYTCTTNKEIGGAGAERDNLALSGRRNRPRPVSILRFVPTKCC